MKRYYQFVQVLFLIFTMQTIVIAQQPDTIKRGDVHSFTYEKPGILWGKVYDQGRTIPLTTYRSIIQLNQPQALQHFDQYQTHVRRTKNLFTAFIILCTAGTIASAIAKRNGNSDYLRVAGPSVGITGLALAGLGLHQRSKAQKELRQSVLSINR